MMKHKFLIKLTSIILIAIVVELSFLLHKGKNFKNADELLKELKSRKYTIESIEDVPKNKVRWFSGNEKLIQTSSINLTVYEFNSEEEAINEANKVSKDGFEIDAPVGTAGNTQTDEVDYLVAYINWGDNPHFYRSGMLIVIYSGTNLKVQYDLYRILGRQFAGLKWYIPGRKH